ncbi:MAG: hypothetical protein FIB07_03670 [Candidatus Methanoperedens sp.]|nr:hypothetical protein [Candidatus Methanoperedens sp.]
MKTLRLFLSIFLLFALIDMAAAEIQWINNITVREYNITWGYTEIYTGMDSIGYKISIDTGIGNNDSFVNAWEVLKADKEERKRFKTAIENELDIRINNETYGIEMTEVDSSLSQAIIGNTNIPDAIENRYNVNYRLKQSIYNANSIWFLGEPESPVTIILPQGIDVKGISGMDNETETIDSHIEVTGFFSNLSDKRGEITINITKNESYNVTAPETNITEMNNTTESNNITEIPSAGTNENVTKDENITKPASEISNKIRNWGIFGIGIIFIMIIYFFKVRKNL